MVHLALGHSNPLSTLHSPCSTQTEQGFALDGNFSAFLGLEKIPQPDNFKNVYR